MPRYVIENSGENLAYIVDALDARSACDLVGWQLNLCMVWIPPETEIFIEDPTTLPLPVKPRHLGLSDPMNQKLLAKFLAVDWGNLNVSKEEDLSYLQNHHFAD